MPQDNPPYSEDEKTEFRANPKRLAELRANLTQVFDTFGTRSSTPTRPRCR